MSAVLAAIALAWIAAPAEAAARFSVTGTRNWNVTSSWSTACGGAGGSSVPGAADTVTICPNSTINVTAAVTTTTVAITGSATQQAVLNVNTGTTTFTTVTVGARGTLNVAATTTMGNLTITGVAGQPAVVNLTGGTTTAGAVAINLNSTFSVGTTASATSLTIASGGIVSFSGSPTLTLTAATPVTLNSGGSFTPGSGTVRLTQNAATTLASGTATAISFNNLLFEPTMSASYTYTLAAGSIATMTVNGDLDVKPPSVGNTRTLTIADGTLATGAAAAPGLVVSGTLNLQAGNGAGGDERVTFNTGNVNMSFGRMILGDNVGGASNINTFSAGSSIVTMTGGSGPLMTRNATGVFNDGTSTVVMSPSASVTLTSGDFTGGSTFNSLTVNMPSLTGTPGGAIATASNLTITDGTLDITANTLTVAGTCTINGGVLDVDGGDLTVTGNTVVNTGGSLTVTTGNLAVNGGTGITINTGGSMTVKGGATTVGDEIIVAGGSLQIDNGTVDVGNAINEAVILQNVASSSFTMNGGALNIAGRFTSNNTAGVGTFTLANGTITVGTVGNTGNNALNSLFFIGSGTQFNMSGGVINIQSDNTGGVNSHEYRVTATSSNVTGGTVQIGNALTVSGEVFQVYSVPPIFNLSLNAANSPAVTLLSSVTVNGTLTLTANHITTGTFTLTIGPAGTITGAGSSSHIFGNLEKVFSSATTFTYTVGDGANYTPVQVVFNSPVTGSLTAAVSSAADHPNTSGTGTASGIGVGTSVNRYWTLKNSTITGTYAATFNYIGATGVDLDCTLPCTAEAPNFSIRRGATCSGAPRNCPTWVGMTVAPTPSTTQATATSISIVSGAAEADFVIGQITPVGNLTRERQFIYTREFY